MGFFFFFLSRLTDACREVNLAVNAQLFRVKYTFASSPNGVNEKYHVTLGKAHSVKHSQRDVTPFSLNRPYAKMADILIFYYFHSN